LPTLDQAKGLGIPLSAYAAQPPVVVWPENRQAVEVFQAMSTQWVCAPMGGFYALNYGSLPVVWDALEVPASDRGRLLNELRWLERAALSAMEEKKD